MGPAQVTSYRVAAPPGPAAPRLRVALFADPHACTPFMGLDRLAALVDRTNALGCDLILMLGDYVGHVWGARPLPPASVAGVLAGLTAPIGVFGIFGNHDWRDDPAARDARRPTAWHHAFAEAGLHMLSNAATVLETGQGPITLAGLESQQAFKTFFRRRAGGMDDLPALLPQMPAGRFTLLMAHEPDIFPELPDHVTLTVCGHTHGGQIRPFDRPLIVPSRFGTRYARGHYRDGARQMIVSGGLGMSGPPLRWRCPPELVVVEIA
ncbi:metallophosphoesterase [Pseudoponticoccus marisrubri]|uniref:Calcineurin-like phosphoesterase domain-containing protein n=1 Tax=Pseudoponticoccus marisrubri TaxID=1685382 RepID=A0A0W7WP93_9RHOB|nr:metallophosphoesterase [Pseudoponticoccus marisrubri]KUF12421.1 hypothetical protein AVJ23_01445 [Pseudoponticoccus marisrubri]